MLNPKMIVRESLKKMFAAEGYFSITDLDGIAQVLGILIPAETRTQLRLLHCIHWRDMDPEVRVSVGRTIDELLSNPDNLEDNFKPVCIGGTRKAFHDPLRIDVSAKAWK